MASPTIPASNGVTTSSNSGSLAVPSAKTDGDLLIVVTSGQSAAPVPSGSGLSFTEIQSTNNSTGQYIRSYWAVWNTGDATTLTMSGGSGQYHSSCIVVQGAYSTPIADSDFNASDADPPALTYSYTDVLVFTGYASANKAGSYTPPTDYTEQVDVCSNNDGPAANSHLGVATRALTGSTGADPGAPSGAGSNQCSVDFAVQSAPPVEGSFSANAVVKKAQSGSFAANAVIKKAQAGSFTADAAFVEHHEYDFPANAVIKATRSGSFTADAVFFRAQAGSLTASAVISRSSGTKTFTADAVISKTSGSSLSADAVVKKTISGSPSADAIIGSSTIAAFTADSIAKATVSGSFSADAVIPGEAGCVWTTPADDTEMDASPTLAFLMPTSPQGDMHFEIQIDTVDTYPSPTIWKSHSDLTGWEFWDGDSWEPVPQSGVPASYGGNEARYTVQSPLASGTYYRRVRAGVI